VTLFDGGGDQIRTVAEVAAVLDYSERYVRTQAEAGVLPSFKVGDELMFSKAELEQWFLKLKIMMKSIDVDEDDK
jgi:excisionase family DNA binding protein